MSLSLIPCPCPFTKGLNACPLPRMICNLFYSPVIKADLSLVLSSLLGRLATTLLVPFLASFSRQASHWFPCYFYKADLILNSLSLFQGRPVTAFLVPLPRQTCNCIPRPITKADLSLHSLSHCQGRFITAFLIPSQTKAD